MRKEIRELHRTLVELVGLMNQPQRDSALLEEAGVALDRALFPLLIVVEQRGPLGVVELSDFAGRDYTTVSRQIAKLDSLGLVARRQSKADKRAREITITAQGKKVTGAIDGARERMATIMFARWSERDLRELSRLMRRFAKDLQNLPVQTTP